MKTRRFRPPPVCEKCFRRPLLGATLIRSGGVWLCAQCLTDEQPGKDSMSKAVFSSVQADGLRGASRRSRAAGDIESATEFDWQSRRHQQVAIAVHQHGNNSVQGVKIVNSEALPRTPGYLRDTLSDPDLAAIESSETRGRLLEDNDVVALGVDVSNTVRAANTAEKLIAHQIALAHKVAMQQAQHAQHERDPTIQIKRLQLSAKMMATAQQGMLTLQRIRTGGTQNVVVQHVHVEAGGQAVVGSVQHR